MKLVILCKLTDVEDLRSTKDYFTMIGMEVEVINQLVDLPVNTDRLLVFGLGTWFVEELLAQDETKRMIPTVYITTYFNPEFFYGVVLKAPCAMEEIERGFEKIENSTQM